MALAPSRKKADPASDGPPPASPAAAATAGTVGAAPQAEKLKRIGDWIFGETLGQGSFGKVKLAHHAKTKEKVAIKIVDKSGIANVEDVERVYRETFILTTLKHQNIIKLFEVLDTPKSIMLVMEYAGGGELFSYVSSKHRLGELESCRLFQQIIAGVEYCHRAKIIHRDLKLENILLDNSTPPNVKIADFGLSNSIKFGQKMDTSCLTPDHSVLVRGRGWVPITDAREGEEVWALRYLGSEVAAWSRVIATTTRTLEPGEKLVHFQSGDTDLLVTADHQMWTRDPHTHAWAAQPAATVPLDRQLLTAAPPADDAPYSFNLPFLPAAMSPDEDAAWCNFIGCFLRSGRLIMVQEDQSNPKYIDSNKQVHLAPTSLAGVALLNAALTRLGWLCPDAPSALADGHLPSPCFYATPDGGFIAAHARLYDLLWPMIASNDHLHPNNSAPIPITLALAIARQSNPIKSTPTHTHQPTNIEQTGQHTSTHQYTPELVHPTLTKLLGWAAGRCASLSPAAHQPELPLTTDSSLPVVSPSLHAPTLSLPSPVTFASVSSLARTIEHARVADTDQPPHAILDSMAHRITAIGQYDPIQSAADLTLAPCSIALHLPVPMSATIGEKRPGWKSGTFRAIETAMRRANLTLEGGQVMVTQLIPIVWADWFDTSLLPLLNDCYAPIGRASVAATISSGVRVVVAFGAHACRLYNELPKSGPTRYTDGIRYYHTRGCDGRQALIIEAPHPNQRAPSTMAHITRAITLAQQFAADGYHPPLATPPPSTTVTSPDADSPLHLTPADESQLGQLLCHAPPVADESGIPTCFDLASHRSLYYGWRFELGPRQSRALIEGWLCAAHSHSHSMPTEDKQQHEALVGYTPSQPLIDDLTTLAVRAGYPCTVRAHTDDAAPADLDGAGVPQWKICFGRSSSDVASSPAAVSTLLSSESATPFVSDHGFTSTHCITVESGNFMVRRDRCGSSTAYIGNCGTPSYTCPEQIMGRKYIGNPADVWSLGVILFAMISGFLPFESTSIPALFRKIKNRSFRFPDYMSKEAQDLIGSMLTVDPEKRATIAELRNHPWFMMQYTDLADIIESQKPVTPEMVSEARAACMAVGDDPNSAALAAAAANATPVTNARIVGVGAKHHHKSSASGGVKGVDDLAKSSAGSVPSGSGEDEKDIENGSTPSPTHAVSPHPTYHHQGTTHGVPHHHHAHSASSSSGGAMGVRPRERVPSCSGIGGISSGVGAMGLGMGMGMGVGGGAMSKPGTAKMGFRDRSGRSSPPTATVNGARTRHGTGAGSGGGQSIFDKLSVRTEVGHSNGHALAPNSAGAGGRFPRFSPNMLSSDGGVRFPPIGQGSPSSSPLPSDTKRGRPNMIGHGHDVLANSASSTAAPRARRPSEFNSNIPSYMQPTENAQNHLLASEREAAENEAASSTPGGRVRGRSSVIHSSSPLSGGSVAGGVGALKSRLDRVGLHDVTEDSLGHSTPTGGAHHAATRTSVIKTPRTREINGTTTPAYMLETNSSRQRGSTKPQQDL